MRSAINLLKTIPGSSKLEALLVRIAESRAAAGDPALVSQLADMAVRMQAELAHLKRALEVEQRRFHATFSQAPVGIAHVGLDGQFLLVNDQFARITGHSVEALLREGFQRITHPDDLASDIAHVQRLLSQGGDRYVMEKRYLQPDGGSVWVNLTVALIRDAAGEPDFFVSVIEDLSEIKRAHSDALRDPLTGLFNRRGFLDRATRDLRRAARAGHAVTLVYLDIDGFKSVNDRQGHAAGDVCLTGVARIIEAKTRPGDVLARIGGDEFTLFLPQLSQADAAALLDGMRIAIADYGVETGNPISSSFGAVSLVPPRLATVEQLLTSADEAMLLAKRSGKNCVRFSAD